MAANDVRKNLAVFVDGTSYVGDANKVTAPKLTLVTEKFRGGGMQAPIALTMGMEEMVADVSFVSYDKDILALFSLVEGANVPLVVRELLESFDGTETAVVHTMTGKVTEIDPGESQPGVLPELKYTMSLSYYKLQHGDTVVHEIDVVNLIQIINGTDVLATARTALGI